MYHARRNFATSGVHLSPSLCFIVPRGLTVTHITNFAFKQVRPKASSIRTFDVGVGNRKMQQWHLQGQLHQGCVQLLEAV